MLLNRLLSFATIRRADAELEASEGKVDRPEYSMSNTLTCPSPAHVTRVRSFECGMNLTENMLAVWPVATVVVSTKGIVDESG